MAKKFLDYLEETGNVREAADKAGVGRNSVYLWRRDDEEFSKAWDARIAVYGDMLEAEAFRRAYHGIDKPVFHQGVQCGVIREYSDPLLARMLARFKPEYADRSKVEHAGSLNVTNLTDEEIAAKLAAHGVHVGPQAAD